MRGAASHCIFGCIALLCLFAWLYRHHVLACIIVTIEFSILKFVWGQNEAQDVCCGVIDGKIRQQGTAECPAPYCLFHLDLAYLMQTKRNAGQICSYSLLIPSQVSKREMEKLCGRKLCLTRTQGRWFDGRELADPAIPRRRHGEITKEQMNGHLYF